MLRRGLLAAAVMGLGVFGISSARASTVDVTYDLDLNGMSTGTCPGGICCTVKIAGEGGQSVSGSNGMIRRI